MPVRVGFVGCGGMAGGHINNWAAMKERGEDVQLAAFCDVDERATLVDLLWSTERARLRSRYHTKANLAAHLATVRRTGYCCFDGPERLSAVAVPVSRDGRVIAALSLRYFTAAMARREAVRRYFEPLAACARHIQDGRVQ